LKKANYEYRFRVPFSDIDMMRHVNNARYFTWFETARLNHMISNFGKVLQDRPDEGAIMAHAEIDYRAPAEWNDELLLKLRVSEVGNSSWTYEYEVTNEKKNGLLIAQGKTVQVAYDYERGRKIPIPPNIRAKLVEDMESTKE